MSNNQRRSGNKSTPKEKPSMPTQTPEQTPLPEAPASMDVPIVPDAPVGNSDVNDEVVDEQTADQQTSEADDSPDPAPTPTPTPEPVAEDTVEAFLATRYKDITTLPKSTLNVIKRMREYIQHMNPDVPVAPADGAIQQRALFSTLEYALASKNGEHRMNLDAVLWFMHKERTATFADRYIMRFLNETKLAKDRNLLFQRLLHLFNLTANPATRLAQLVNFDMRRFLPSITDLPSQQNLIDFYQPR